MPGEKSPAQFLCAQIIKKDIFFKFTLNESLIVY